MISMMKYFVLRTKIKNVQTNRLEYVRRPTTISSTVAAEIITVANTVS